MTEGDAWPPTDPQLGMLNDANAGSIQCWARLPGRFDLSALQTALHALMQRHDILRTGYVRDGHGRLWAVTQPTVTAPIEICDFRGSRLPVNPYELQRRAQAFVGRPVDPVVGPLVRGLAFLRDDEETSACFAIHHSLIDFASQEIFASELAELYDASLTGRKPRLPPGPMPFGELAREHRAWIDGPDAHPHLEYWRAQIAGSSLCELPYDRRTPVGDTRELPHIHGELSDDALERLRQLARIHRCSMFVIVATAFHLVLSRWSGRRDTCSWITHSGRSHPKHHRMIGCFANFWLLRVDLSGDLTFLEAMVRVRARYADALPHTGVTVQKLTPELRRARNGRYVPAIVFNYVPLEHVRAVDTQAAVGRGRTPEGSIVGLNVAAVETATRLSWFIQHIAHLFEEETVQRASSHIGDVLLAAGANPYVRVFDLLQQDVACPA